MGSDQILTAKGIATPATPPPYHYGVYGISLSSEIPLPLPQYADTGLAEIELETAPAGFFSEVARSVSFDPASDEWRQYASLKDRTSYVRWNGVGEFLISADGRRITFGQAERAAKESFLVYLLSQALSFALVKSGIEPLHGTSVVIHGEAIAFLGNSGYGKSTMAANFLQAGYPLLTDDVLVLEKTARGMLAHPGPPRIKLFPKIARLLLPELASLGRMNAVTRKRIIGLGPDHSCGRPVPLRAIYALAPIGAKQRKKQVQIEKMSAKDAFVALVGYTSNTLHAAPDRLQRQFTVASYLESNIRLRRLYCPRSLALLPTIRQAILDDLDQSRADDAARSH